ncbi:helix-turn-helix transcriptional regulator [Kocuria sp.]|uniref:helix-turn-helix transcriptional regulator n=1 Tax=Kocuria sp. TaxID=1871328 RepID=UPI0026DEDAFE|nr:WYL domain-containing protein [Kocuria sp.]MDO5619667.1 WYL domain-containing protein [Kocuria sp.]
MPVDQQRRASERRLNLIFALLYRERGYTRSELRAAVPDYTVMPSDAAFERAFERDKQELRALGFPIEEVPEDAFFEEDTGFRYRIARGSFALPALHFTAEEAAVLSLAANAWTQTALGSTARRALRKLEPVLQPAAGDDDAPLIQPTISVQEPSFAPLMEAVLKHRRVGFDYLAASTDELSTRRVEPWGVGSRFGSWYVTGWDLDRQAERTFRLSRIVSDVRVTTHTFTPPGDFSMNERLDAMEAAPELGSVTVDVAVGRAQMLRRMASATAHGQGLEGATGKFDRLTVPVTEPERVAAEIAAVGPDAFVPASDESAAMSLQSRVRDSVLRRLEAAAAFQQRVQDVPVDWTKASRKPRRSSNSSADRLARMLEIVRYVYGHQGVQLEEVAQHVEASTDQVVEDLTTLFVCGRPGHTPDQLIEASWDQGAVTVTNADEISSPVRLTQPEAAALLVGLQTLRSLPGEHTPAIESTLRKVAEAAGEPATVANAVGARPDETFLALAAAAQEAQEPHAEHDTSSVVAATLRGAIDAKQRVRISYIVASRDEITEREIDPLRLVSANSHWYVMAWCTRAQDFRDFRLDRIRSAVVVGEAEPHEDDVARPPAATAATADQQLVLVTDRRARWVADQYRARRTAAVKLPRARRRTSPAPTGSPGSGRVGASGPVEFEAAEISFTTEELAFSLVTRFGGQVGIVGPHAHAARGQLWVNTALAAYNSDGPQDS